MPQQGQRKANEQIRAYTKAFLVLTLSDKVDGQRGFAEQLLHK